MKVALSNESLFCYCVCNPSYLSRSSSCVAVVGGDYKMKTARFFVIVSGLLVGQSIVGSMGAAVERDTVKPRADCAAARRPPNVLLIMADDVGRETLGCYGGTSYRTPHLDKLARTGTRFTHCYSMPVCHPTRLAIMTGRYPFRNPARWGSFPAGQPTFGNLLRNAGYATAVAGKWQLVLLRTKPEHPKLLGFDQSCLFGWHEGPRYHKPLIWQNGRRRTDVEKPEAYGPDVYSDFLIDFLTRNKDRPFFAYYPMALCHEISDDFQPVPPPAPDGHYLSFKEMVEDMDRVVGRIVAAVDRLGLRDNTLILFTTDNGSPRKYLVDAVQANGKVRRVHKEVVSRMGQVEVRGGKGQLTDAGTRVPLIANWPGTTPAGRTCDDLIDFTDVLPTLAELAGAAPPEGMTIDGRSFAAQLQGRPGKPRERVYCEHRGRRWVRTQRWKLYDDGRLFDMQNDPTEKRPIKADHDSAETSKSRTKLQAALDSLLRSNR